MKFWTPDKITTLRHLWSKNWTVPDIAKYMGVTTHAVTGARKQHGLPLRRQGRQPSPHHKKKAEPKRQHLDVLPTVPAPGWPTRQQLMAGR